VPWQPAPATPLQFAQSTQQPLQRHQEGPSYHPTGQRQSFQQPNDHVNRQYPAPSQPRSLNWPLTGLITAGTVTVLGIVLAGVAGSNPRSALATMAGGIITLGIIGVVVLAIVALAHRRRRRKNHGLAPTPATRDPRSAYPAPTFTGPAFQAPGTYAGPAAAGQQLQDAPQRPYGHGAQWPPHEGSTEWNS
jgi:predicted lipid-binding transport protein (Tim44 family)